MKLILAAEKSQNSNREEVIYLQVFVGNLL